MTVQKRRSRSRGWFLRVAAFLSIIALLAVSAGVIWLLTPQTLLPEAAAALVPGERVQVTVTDTVIALLPASGARATALIVYPGAKVPVTGYAPVGRAIAEQGFPVFLVPMPGNFALLDVDEASRVQAAHPEIERWVIAGHSLGGVAAAQYAARHLSTVQGLVLWASYPTDDLSTSGLKVVSIWGSLDAAAQTVDSADTRAKLPTDTHFVEIPGGNHEQFGYYTGQANDPVAEITRADQQAAIVEATVALLEQVDGR